VVGEPARRTRAANTGCGSIVMNGRLLEPVIDPDRDSGQWQVLTETGSRYIIDLDARTLTRVPDSDALERWRAVHADPVPVVQVVSLNTPAMRRDFDAIPFWALSAVSVGAPMVAVLDVLGNGTPTLRRTSLVLAAEALTPSGGGSPGSH
jgi:hypothetical protein